MPLSARDKTKPLILIGAIAFGIGIQHLIGHAIPWLFVVTEIGVFVVITAVMLPVEVHDIRSAFHKSRPTVIALAINFVFIPAFAWLLGYLILRQHPDFWVGAILYTLTPCIGWYLIFTDLARGNVPWGIALLPWNITLQALLIPVYMWLLVGKVLPIEPLVLVRSVALFLIAPFVIAWLVRSMTVRMKGQAFFEGSIKPIAGEVKLWGLVLVILSMFASQPSIGSGEAGSLIALITFLVCFFLVLFILVVLIGKGFALNYEDTATLAFTTTARNSEAIIGVAVAAFPGHPLVLMAILLGPVIELPVLLLIAHVMLKLKTTIWGVAEQ